MGRNIKKYHSPNYRNSDSCHSFWLLKAIAKGLPLLFANAFQEPKRANTIAVAIVGRAITIYKQYRKEAMNQSIKLIQKFKQRD